MRSVWENVQLRVWGKLNVRGQSKMIDPAYGIPLNTIWG